MISTCGSHMVFTSVKATAARKVIQCKGSTTKDLTLVRVFPRRSGYKRLSSAIKTRNVSMLMAHRQARAADKETVLVWTSEEEFRGLSGEGQVETQMELNGYIYLSFIT